MFVVKESGALLVGCIHAIACLTALMTASVAIMRMKRTIRSVVIAILGSRHCPAATNGRNMVIRIFAVALVGLLSLNQNAFADTQYFYDGSGRLVEAVAADGSSARYQYDAAGNITAIDRNDANTLTIASFSPAIGSAGINVIISGTGFSTTPSQNTVAFNGANAVVASATQNQLTVTVPAGATTGTISVSNTNGTATSAANFTVIPTLAISGLAPASGAVNTAVTIMGTGFDPVPGSNQVRFNNTYGIVSSASATQLQTLVPANASSGRISVSNLNGVAQSSSDFIIPPGSYSPADIVTSSRVTAGGANQVVTISTPNKIGLVVFDGVQGQRMTLVLTNVTMGGSLTIYKPDGTVYLTAMVANNGVIDIPPLPMGGSYTISFAPGSTSGNATVGLVTDASSAAVENTPTAFILAAGQNASYRFDGVAGKSYGLALTNITTNPSGGTIAVTILKPDGSTFTSANNCSSFTATSGNCDISPLPVSGTYTVRLNPAGINSASFSALVTQDMDGGALSVNGATLTDNVTLPGRNARYTLAGTAGQSLSLVFSNNTIARGTIFIYSPDGTVLASTNFNGIASGTLDVVIPVTGAYSVAVYADAVLTGSISLRLLADQTGTLATDGTPAVLALQGGQNATYTFSGTAGQGYSFALTGLSSNPSGASVAISIKNPDGSNFANAYNCASFTATSGNCDLSPLPVTGTYTIRLDPSGIASTSFTAVLSQNVAGGALSVGGSYTTLNSTIPGQNAIYTFDGTAGQGISIPYMNNNIPAGTFVIFAPNGTAVASIFYNGTTSGVLDAPSLPVTGAYTLMVFKDYKSTGRIDFRILADATGSITADGTPIGVTLVAGQNASYAFAGAAGAFYNVALTNFSSLPAGASVSASFKNPNGTPFSNSSYCVALTATSGTCDTSAFTTSGTYTLRLDPSGTAATTFNVILSPTIEAGSLVINGAPITYSTSIPGQNVRYTFSGAAGQNLAMAYSNNTLPTGSLIVFRPDGTQHAFMFFSATSSGALMIPTLPTAGTYTFLMGVDGTSTGHMDLRLQTR